MQQKHALNKTVSDYTFRAKRTDGDVSQFFDRIEPKLLLIKKKYLTKHPIKITLAIQVKLKKITSDNDERIVRPWFNTNKAYEIFRTSRLRTLLKKIVSQLNDNFETFLKFGSGFVLEKIKRSK